VFVLLIGEHFWTATGEHYYTAIDINQANENLNLLFNNYNNNKRPEFILLKEGILKGTDPELDHINPDRIDAYFYANNYLENMESAFKYIESSFLLQKLERFMNKKWFIP
jgi:hypothetical protein